MKLIFLTLVCLTLSLPALSKSIICEVENPCGWLNPASTGDDSLGYCVPRVSGDEKSIQLERYDAEGKPLEPFSLKVKLASAKRIEAKHEEAELYASLYENDIYLGTLAMIKSKLGFFISCQIAP